MRRADVVVLGGGLAGLTTALACSDRGLRVVIVANAHAGAASPASAGVLGPSIGRGPKGGRVGRFMFAARDRYPAFLAALHERTPLRVPVVAGAIEVALNDVHVDELRRRGSKMADTRVLEPSEVDRLEPALRPVAGALHHPKDGAVDPTALLAAIAAAIDAEPRITIVNAQALAIAAIPNSHPSVTLSDGSTHGAPHVVIATGAWAAALGGLPRALPVRPVKGEMAVARFDGTVRHVIFGAGGYLLPRGEGLLIGATSHDAAFDASVTNAALGELGATATALLSQWSPAGTRFTARYAGLRPMTPDGYPILGQEPTAPGIVYACGYSRNGVLIAPLAADCLAALIVGEPSSVDLSAFAVTRFGG